MKLKTKSCSTGHGTGVTPPVDLSMRLWREKMRLKLKQAGRQARMAEKRFRHGKPQAPGGELA